MTSLEKGILDQRRKHPAGIPVCPKSRAKRRKQTDIRNHIAVVKKLLQSGKLEEAITYMEDLDDMAEKCQALI